MKRRTKGDGTVRKRADGRWMAEFYYLGERKSIYGKTKQAVLDELKEIKRQIAAGQRFTCKTKRCRNGCVCGIKHMRLVILKKRHTPTITHILKSISTRNWAAFSSSVFPPSNFKYFLTKSSPVAGSRQRRPVIQSCKKHVHHAIHRLGACCRGAINR